MVAFVDCVEVDGDARRPVTELGVLGGTSLVVAGKQRDRRHNHRFAKPFYYAVSRATSVPTSRGCGTKGISSSPATSVP